MDFVEEAGGVEGFGDDTVDTQVEKLLCDFYRDVAADDNGGDFEVTSSEDAEQLYP